MTVDCAIGAAVALVLISLAVMLAREGAIALAGSVIFPAVIGTLVAAVA